MAKMRKYEVEVTFIVDAEQDCDAETALVYALEHSPLLGPHNNIRFETGDARPA